MKLQPWLQKARQGGYQGIMTKGGPWSNHVHAAAYACYAEGISFTALIKGKDQMVTPMITDILKWNTKLEYCQHEEYKDDTRWIDAATKINLLYVPVGGEGPEGVEGVRDFFNQQNLSFYHCVICPVGTATTMIGIAHSNIGHTKLIGINPGIEDKNFETVLANLRHIYINRLFQILGDSDLRKFGQWPSYLTESMNNWYRNWQLPTDIVYTAKMFYQFEALVQSGFFEPRSRILLIHTGGLQGNRSITAGTLVY